MNCISHETRCAALDVLREMETDDNRVAFVMLHDGSIAWDFVAVPPSLVGAYAREINARTGMNLRAADVHGGTWIGGPTKSASEYREPYRMIVSTFGEYTMSARLVGPLLFARSVWYSVIGKGTWDNGELWQPPGAEENYSPPPRNWTPDYDHAFAWRRVPARTLVRKIREELTHEDWDFVERLREIEKWRRQGARKTVIAALDDRQREWRPSSTVNLG